MLKGSKVPVAYCDGEEGEDTRGRRQIQAFEHNFTSTYYYNIKEVNMIN